MTAPKTLRSLIETFWPRVREAYLSPLSHGDDVIVAWQVEVNYGDRTEAWSAPTEDGALDKAFEAITKGKVTDAI